MARRKLFEEPVDPNAEPEVAKLKQFRLEANAIFSKHYTGKVNFGTYSEHEDKRMRERIATLQAEGYTTVEVVEVL